MWAVFDRHDDCAGHGEGKGREVKCGKCTAELECTACGVAELCLSPFLTSPRSRCAAIPRNA